MNFLALQTAVYDLTSSSATKGIASATEVKRWINEGQRKVATQIAELMEGHFKAQTNISEVADQTSYNLPSDCIRVISLERTKDPNGVALGLPYFIKKVNDDTHSIDDNRHQQPANAGNKSYGDTYFQVGLTSFTLLTGSPGTATDSLRLTYIARVADMVSDDDDPFQFGSTAPKTAGAGDPTFDEWHDILYLYACERVFLKEENWDQHGHTKQMRMEREHELRQFLDRANTQAPRTVVYNDDEDFF